MTAEIYIEEATATGDAPEASLEELLAFERLLAWLSSRFANVSGDKLETEIESALRQLLQFLDFDRGTFGEFTADGWATILCSVAKDRVEPYPPGPAPAFLSWYLGQLRAGKILRVRSLDALPPEAVGELEYFRRSGIHSSLGIPLRVSGGMVCVINFSAFRSTRDWPDGLIARLKIIGEVMAQALVRKRSEAALQAARSTLARITRLTTMHEVTASIAHEVSQPLAAIVANGDAALRWLQRTPPEVAEVAENVNQIISNAHRASRVVATVRGMFKKDEHAKVFLCINEVVEEVVELLHGELNNRRVLVRTNLTHDLPQISADRVQLQQVILNLVMNAAEAMSAVPDGLRVLNISSKLGQSDEVIVVFEDCGPGVDPKNIDRIFEPFFTTKSEGMGMGLAICRSIIEAHRGNLSASPGIAQGAVFQIALPVHVLLSSGPTGMPDSETIAAGDG
jgi:C4-dicarboxylate-specific signal transduction histidine kinase